MTSYRRILRSFWFSAALSIFLAVAIVATGVLQDTCPVSAASSGETVTAEEKVVNPHDEVEPPPPKVTVRVTPDQDVDLRSDSQKVSLYIPKGALDQQAEIEMTEHGQEGPKAAGMLRVFELNAFVVHWGTVMYDNKITQFKQGMTLSIKHDTEELRGLDVDTLKLYYLDEDKGQWLPVPDSRFDRETNTLTATIQHFSYYGEVANPTILGPGKVMAYLVDLHSGAAISEYAIEAPPGSGDFQPSIKLLYNSASIDEMKNKKSVGSWVGIGWSLGLGSISYEAGSDQYLLSLDGQSYYRLVQDALGVYHTDPESFYKITRTGQQWDVYDREGNYYRYGGTTDSQQYCDNSTYYRWDLSYSQDTNTANAITVTYVQDIWTDNLTNTHVRSAYPSHVRYNNDHVDIQFNSSYDTNEQGYGPLRRDNPQEPIPKVVENRKLDSIEAKVDGNLAKKYVFTYNTTDDYYSDNYGGTYYAGKHTLTSITEIGADGTSSLPATSFTYTDLEIYHYDDCDGEYSGNPGNPASLYWPYLTTITNGYGATVTYSYTQEPTPTPTLWHIWTREVVTTRTVNPGTVPQETYQYAYTGNPQYVRIGPSTHAWDDLFRGFSQVRVTDAQGNYAEHYFYTTGSGDTETLTGKEYKTEWYNSSAQLLEKKDFTWAYRYSDTQVPPLGDSTAIDVGGGATNRSSDLNSATYTDLDKANPANADGYLTSVSFWFNQAATGVKVGTFYQTGTNTYKCRAAATIGSVAAGSKQTFTVSLEVKAGDLIGWYVTTGRIEKDSSGSGIKYVSGDFCVAGQETTYSEVASYGVSIYGEGGTPAAAAYWKLDENSGQTLADDSGSGNTGTRGPTTATESSDPSWTTGGRFSSALDFDGVDDYADIGDGSSLNLTDNFTLSAMVRRISLNSEDCVIASGTGQSISSFYHQYLLSFSRYEYDDVYPVVFAMGNSTKDGYYHVHLSDSAGISDADWHLITVTFDGQTSTIYIDGISKSTSTGTSGNRLTADLVDRRIGSVAAGAKYFHGPIDDVRIYNRVLSPTEIANMAKWSIPFVYLQQVTDTMGSKTSRIRYEYDAYGNTTREYQDGDTSISTDDSVIERDFYPNTSANILSCVAAERVKDGSGNTKQETLYYYDGNNTSVTTPPTKGNLTRVEKKKGDGGSVSTYSTYDNWGNTLTDTDANGNVWTTVYESTYHTFPQSITSPITGQSESYTFDAKTGNLLSRTDVNGQTTSYEYDTFGRLTKVVKPGDSSGSPTIQYQYNNWGTLNQQHLKTLTKVADGDYLWKSEYFDGLGRVIQTQARGETGRTIIDSTTAYNNRGLVDKVYVSQDLDSSQVNGYKTPEAGWKYTSYVYDGLQQVTSITAADGTVTSTDYSTPWQETVTNPNGYKHRYYYDAFKRLTKVEELDASQAVYATTTYAYDVLGNLTQITDANSNVTTMSYDWLSRKTSMTHPDLGAWSYSYDANGNPTSQTDAKSQTITYTYDALDRLTGKTYPTGSGMTDVTYTYDSTSGGNYGKGHRTGMTDASGITAWKYDARGRLIEEKRTIDSVDYVTQYAYDSADRVTAITYPTGETVAQTYNGRGLSYSLSGSVVGDLATSTLYNQLGDITRINLGNATYTTFTYYGLDTSSGYYSRLWQIKTTKTSPGDLQDMTYTWDANGNLTQRQDAVAGTTETFTYDFLDRLTGVSGAYSNSYAYNKIGNITSFNGTSYTYGTKPHAVSAVGSTSYTYDANGNMTQRGAQTLTWDVENRLIGSVTQIDVGAGAIDRSSSVNSAGYTDLDMANPANADGYLTSVSFWFNQAATGVRVGTFYLVSGSTYKCRDSATIGSVAAGSKQTFTQDSESNPLSLEVKAGDLIGWYVASGSIEKDSSGSGIRYISGEYIDPGDQGSYSTVSGYGVSIYGEALVEASFVYDGDDNRVKKTEGGETILYINKYYEKNIDTGEVTTHYFLGEREIAYRKGSTLEYVCQDHLGSTAVTVNTSGTAVARIAYFPFGATRSLTGGLNTDKRFTGQRLDETGLYFYNARYYDATIGRFISADTVIPDYKNPQDLNPYTYCLNNPMVYVDPTGHWWNPFKAVKRVFTSCASTVTTLSSMVGKGAAAVYRGARGVVSSEPWKVSTTIFSGGVYLSVGTIGMTLGLSAIVIALVSGQVYGVAGGIGAMGLSWNVIAAGWNQATLGRSSLPTVPGLPWNLLR